LARRARIRWDQSGLTTNLSTFDQKIDRGIRRIVDFQATRSESAMRTNAPWTDQTSNARNGLYAKPIHEPKKHVILLAHSMPYGIWLEVRWSGKYGIIPETVRQGGDEVMQMLTRLFNML
jgi:hypothetical protein